MLNQKTQCLKLEYSNSEGPKLLFFSQNIFNETLVENYLIVKRDLFVSVSDGGEQSISVNEALEELIPNSSIVSKSYLKRIAVNLLVDFKNSFP